MKPKAAPAASASQPPGPGFAAQESLSASDGYVTEEALRGERLGCWARWAFMAAGQAIFLYNLLVQRQVMGSRWGMALLGLGMLYNLWLHRRLARGLFPIWISYISVTLDALVVLGYGAMAAIHVSPTAAATSPSLFILPVILLFVALRHSRGLLLYATIISVGGMGLVYHIFLPLIPPETMGTAVGLDPPGVVVRLIFLALFGGSLFFVPLTIKRLIAKQQSLYAERQAAELRHRRDLEAQVQARTAELVKANQELQKALDEVKTLSGLLPICASCKKIRDDGGYWRGVEEYLSTHSQAEFTHAICPDCMARLYPELFDRVKDKL